MRLERANVLGIQVAHKILVPPLIPKPNVHSVLPSWAIMKVQDATLLMLVLNLKDVAVLPLPMMPLLQLVVLS